MLLPEEARGTLLEEARKLLGTPRAQDGIAEKLTSLTERERQVLEGIGVASTMARLRLRSPLSEKTCATM